MTPPKLLLVDDEVNILNALKRLLIHENFDITATDSPFEALHLVSKAEFTVIVSDQRMPHMEGIVLLKKIKTISPIPLRILLTGYADMDVALSAINEGEVFRFLSKPWNDETLIQTLKQAAEHYETVKAQKTAQQRNAHLKEKTQALTEKNMDLVFHNRRLGEEVNRSYIISVQAMAKSMKLYEPRLWHHALSVKMICGKIAQLLGLTPQQSTQLETAALLHDIGQVGLPRALLKKPESALKPAEQELWREHSFNGFSIVGMIPYFQEAALLIRHHHEAFDGGGYPSGLKGQAIPAGSRMIAVADAYATLKKGHPLTMDDSAREALAFLESRSGTQFDPDAVALIRNCVAPHPENKNAPEQQSVLNHWREAIEANAAQFVSEELYRPDFSMPIPSETADSGIETGSAPQGDTLSAQTFPASGTSTAASALPMNFGFEEEENQFSEALPPWQTEEAWLAYAEERPFSPIGESAPSPVASASFEDSSPPLPSFPDPVPRPARPQSVPDNQAVGNPGSVPDRERALFPDRALPDTGPEEQAFSPEVAWDNLPAATSTQTPDTQNPPSPPSAPESPPGPGSIDAASLNYLSKSKQVLKNVHAQAYRDARQQKYREVVISPAFLCAGMVLARDLVTTQGVKLLQKGSIINPEQLPGLKSYLSRNGLDDLEIYVLKPLQAR